MIWSLESLYEPVADISSVENQSSLSLGPVFDVKFLSRMPEGSIYTGTGRNSHIDELSSKYNERNTNLVRMVTPDDSNCLRVLDDGNTIFKSPSEEGNMIR